MDSPAQMRVLGPIELRRSDGEAQLGGPKQKAVLAMLIAARGQVLSRSSIIMGVWGQDASDRHQGSFHTYVSNLRALLGGVIERRGDGYVIAPDALQVDAWEFEDAVERGRSVLATSPAEADETLHAALGLWRGLPYFEAADTEGLQTEIRRLEDLRLDGVELRMEAALALGRHEEVSSELEALTLEYPLRERFRAQHMLALYRSDRQAEALRAFERARQFLSDELGLDPSPALVDLELRILQQDPSLAIDAGQTTTQRLGFLFTDIEGSTGLWDLHPQDMARALERHDAILTEAVQQETGTVFKHTGDGVLAAFPDANRAAAAAEAAQRSLAAQEWHPLPPVRVRMGIDVGDVDTRDGDFFGPPLNRCARIVAAAHGGQVLLSAAAQDDLTASGFEGLQIRQLGEHRLRGLSTPERIGQLVFIGLPAEFPPVRTHISSVDLSDRLTAEALPGYELRDAVGRGTFGVVYRAYQPSVRREVAVKVIRPEYASHPAFIRRFEAEAQMFASLQHPHIVPLFDFWRNPSGAYLVMQLLQGGSLDQALTGEGWDPARAARLIHQLAAAVAYGHSQGIVHRDIKPGNILLDGSGNAYLGDFGIAARLLDPIEDGELPSSAPGFRAPEDRSGTPPDPRSDIFSLGVLTHQLLTGLPPATDPDTASQSRLTEPLSRVIATATAPRPEDRYPSVEQLVAALDTALQDVELNELVSVRTELRNPYKGLAAFGEGDAGDFFGRADLTETLVTALARHPFVTVVGPSGSGKSSVVRAGLLPRLRHGAVPGSEAWFITDLTPGARPLEALAEAVEAIADAPVTDAVGKLSRSGKGLEELLSESMSDPDATVLVVVDQLEELYTQAVEAERTAFIEALAQAVTSGTVRVVATLRADFYDRPLSDPALGALTRNGLVTALPPSRTELVEAIEGPGAGVGVTFEPGLPARIAADVHGRPGALPLLQFALTQLFDRRTTDHLSGSDYDKVGGVLGALGRQAEAAHGSLTEAQVVVAEELMLRLVSIEEDADVTRRRVRRAELESLALDRESVAAVLDAYGRSRLLSFDRDPISRGATVELAHEALLDSWPRLAGWIEQHRETLILTRRLRAAVVDWELADRSPDFLLGGDRLARYRSLTGARTITAAEEAYLAASEEAAAAALAADRRRRLRRRLVGSAAMVTAIAAVVAIVSFLGQARQAERQTETAEQQAEESRQQAEESRQEAEQQGLISQALQEAGPRTDLSLLLAVEAYRRDPGPASQQALLAALQSSSAERTLDAGLHAGPPAVEFCPATVSGPGVFVSIGGSEGESAELVAHDIGTGDVARLQSPLTCWADRLSDGRYIGRTGDPLSFDFSPLAVVDPAGDVLMLPPDLRRFLGELPDRRLLFEQSSSPAGDDTGFVVVVDPITGEVVDETGVQSLEATIDPTGRFAATQDFSPGNPVRGLMDLTSFTVTPLAEQIESPYWWAPDGSELLSISGPEVVRFAPDGSILGQVTIPTSSQQGFQSVSFAPSGTRVAALSDAGIEVFSFPGFELVAGPVEGSSDATVISMLDDRLVALHSRTGLVQIVNPAGGSPIERRVPFGRFNDTLFMLNGDYGLVWLAEGPLNPVDLETGTRVDPADLGMPPDSVLLPLGTDRWITFDESVDSPVFIVLDQAGAEMDRISPPGILPGFLLVHPSPGGALLLFTTAGEPERPSELVAAHIDAATLEVEYTAPIQLADYAEPIGWTDAAFWIGSSTGDITLWDWTGTPIGTWSGLSGISGATISPDATRFASVSAGIVTVRNAATGTVLAEFAADSLGEDPLFVDDTRLLVRDSDGRVVLWDTDSPEQLGVLALAPEWRPSGFGTGGFDPVLGTDGRSVWFTQPGGFINVDITPDAWIEAACQAAGRTLTPEEWDRLIPGTEPYRDPCAP